MGKWRSSKIWIALLIVCLVFTSMPLSAMAAVPSELTERINKVYGVLTDAEKEAISQARDNLATLPVSVVDSVYPKIEGKAPVTKEELVETAAALAVPYTADGSSLEAAAPKVKKTLDKLTHAAGLEPITWEDLVQFTKDAEERARQELASKSYSELYDKLTSKDGLYELLQEGYDKLLKDETYGNKVKDVIDTYGITASELKTAAQRIVSHVDPDKEASKALLAGYVRSESFLVESKTKNVFYYVDILGVRVPVAAFDWASDNDKVVPVVSDSDGGLYLTTNSNNTQTATITGTFTLAPMKDRVLYAKTHTVEPQRSGGVGGGGGGAASWVTLPSNAKAAIDDAIAELEKLFSGDQKPVTNAEKRAAEKAAEQALRKAAVLDVSNFVKIEDGVAVLDLKASDLRSAFRSIQELADKLNAKLEELGLKPVRVIATLDLGEVDSEQVRIPLAKEIFDLAKEYSIDAIAVSVNGVTLIVDVNEFDKDTTLDITSVDPKDVKGLANANRVGDIYAIEFVAGDRVITAFDTPVTLEIQVDAGRSVDQDLLTLVKIDDGKLLFHGGKYNKDTKSVAGERAQFSTYTVIENKVTFNDIAAVKAWAGREIEVAAAKGIINGRGNGVFDPQADVTRAEFAAMLVRAFGLENNTLKESFNDVNDGDWYQPYVAAAAHYGIVNGRSATVFDPNSNITRAEMATMAANALRELLNYDDAADIEAALAAFEDAADIQEWYKAGVALMAQEELIKGRAEGVYAPNGTATRAEAAVIIYRLFELK